MEQSDGNFIIHKHRRSFLLLIYGTQMVQPAELLKAKQCTTSYPSLPLLGYASDASTACTSETLLTLLGDMVDCHHTLTAPTSVQPCRCQVYGKPAENSAYSPPSTRAYCTSQQTSDACVGAKNVGRPSP